ncbi:MAG: aldo/keto reductase [Lachnospiraceae bacterium]|nr:aldo/keto reductase [Lachnospiraceae bacterium]
MNYTKLQGIGIPVSTIVFGCCNPILTKDEKGAEELLDTAFSNGFNIFDTAKVYGKSEEVLGRWISRAGNRDRIVIITKGCHPDPAPRVSPEALKEDIDSSLKRLKTDYIDIYMLHRDAPGADIDMMLSELNGYVRQGVIKKIGVSNWTCERIEKANERAVSLGLEGFSASSPQMSLARQIGDPWGGGCVSVSWDDESKRWYCEHPEIEVMPYSCLGRGMFSGRVSGSHPFRAWRSLDWAAKRAYWCRENLRRLKSCEKIAKEKGCTVAQAAIAWLLAQDFAVMPVATMSSEKRMIENIGAFDVKLSAEDMKRLNA